MRRLLLPLLLLAACPSWAAVSIDATSTGNTGATEFPTSLTISHTTGSCSNRFMLVGISNRTDSGTAISTVTYNSVDMGSAVASLHNSFVRGSVFKLVAPDTGTFNVVITPAAATRMSATVRTYCGVDQGTPNGTAATASGVANTVTVDVSSATGETVADFPAQWHTNESPLVIGASQTNGAQTVTTMATAGQNVIAATSIEAGATTVTMSWTGADAGNDLEWATIGLSIKPAAAGGSIVPILTQQYRRRRG